MQRNRLSEETSKLTCVVCGEEKGPQEFYLKSREGSKRYKKCKSCYTAYMRAYRKEQRENYNATQRKWWSNNKDYCTVRHKERKYGLQKGQYQSLRDRQDGKCAICKDVLVGSGHLDHNHDTGEARGILCRPCNLGLGSFRDKVENLLNAAKYLEDATVGSERK